MNKFLKTLLAVTIVFFTQKTWAAYTADDFVTTWDISAPGRFVEISFINGQTYNFNVDCNNDGVVDFVNSSITTKCIYSTAGPKTIVVSGDYPVINIRSTESMTLNQWGTEEWKSMYQSFANLNGVHFAATDTPNLSSVGSYSSIFGGTKNVSGDISDWDLSSATHLNSFFYNTQNFNADMTGWVLPSSIAGVTDMFRGAVNFQSNINSWDVSDLKTFKDMFRYTNNFNSDISNWDLSSATRIDTMFYGSQNFNADMTGWVLPSTITTVTDMFRGAVNFQSNINSWDVSNLKIFAYMFRNVNNFSSNISDWDLSSATSLNAMFYGTQNFTAPTTNWNLPDTVTSISLLFAASNGFNSDVGTWNISALTNASVTDMFRGAINFQSNINTWDVSNFKSFAYMFRYSTGFSSNISDWELSSAVNMKGLDKNRGVK